MLLRFVFMPGTAVSVRRGCRAVCLWWLLAVLCAAPGAALPARYSFDSWTTDNGLPHNTITGICQTRDGYVWLTTDGGLVRFDGAHFRVFSRVNTPELTSNSFSYNALREDHEGALWAGTPDAGVIRYHEGVFTSYTTKDGLPSDKVIRIDEDAGGAVWIITDAGVARWVDGRLTPAELDSGSHPGDWLAKPSKYVGFDGAYFGPWRMDASGWQRFAEGQWVRLPLPPHLSDPTQLRIASIVEDSRRRLWYNVVDGRGDYYRLEDGRLTVFHGFPIERFICYEDSRGRLWTSDQHGRTALWAGGQLTPLAGLSTPYVFKVLEDREGTFWIATFKQGLYRLKEQVVTVYRHPGGPQYNAVNILLQDRTARIWAGSGGLARIEEGRFENFYRSGKSRLPWDGSNVLTALYEDRDGTIMAAFRDGLARFSGGKLRTDTALSAEIKGRVRTIYRDNSGDLWLGGSEGLYRQRGGELTRYGAAEGLPGRNVRVIHGDRAGRFWVGTDGGLARFAGGRFSPLTEADGLSSDNISAIYEDEAGVLWVGTYDGGLNRIEADSESLKITRYTTAQGLYDNSVHQILEDDLGFVWIGSVRGIYRIRKQGLEELAAGKVSFVPSTRYGIEDGLVSIICGSGGQASGFKARDGRLWFPTEGGIAVIDPRAVPFNPVPPPVVIEECILDRQTVAFRGGLTVSPGQENLEINYTGLSFIKPEQVRFRYKLEGLDHDWVEAGTRRTAYYSHLPPGDYTFTVTAANSDGAWNTEGQGLRVVVLPPFYRTWWFMTLAAVSIGAAVSLAFHYRVAQLRRAQAAQQVFARQLISSQESERKRIAAELHDSLGQHLVIIKNLALMFLQSPADKEATRQRIEEISAEASQAIGEVKEISYNLRPYQLDRIGLTKAIESLIKKAEAASGVVFTARLDQIDDAFHKESEINFYRIVQESVNNIIKHARATEADVWIRREADRVRLTIRDNGRGFVPGTTNADSGGGFGLLGISERAQLLGGSADVHSAVGQGTIVNISIALQDGHHE